ARSRTDLRTRKGNSARRLPGKAAAAKKLLVKKKPRTSNAAPVQANAKKPATAGGLEAEIKRLDHDILRLVNKRADATLKLLQKRPQPHKAVFDAHADDELWGMVQQSNPGPLSGAAVRSVFREMLSGARALVKSKRVAYLGPAYSFTHIAAIERFGTS